MVAIIGPATATAKIVVPNQVLVTKPKYMIAIARSIGMRSVMIMNIHVSPLLRWNWRSHTEQRWWKAIPLRKRGPWPHRGHFRAHPRLRIVSIEWSQRRL